MDLVRKILEQWGVSLQSLAIILTFFGVIGTGYSSYVNSKHDIQKNREMIEACQTKIDTHEKDQNQLVDQLRGEMVRNRETIADLSGQIKILVQELELKRK